MYAGIQACMCSVSADRHVHESVCACVFVSLCACISVCVIICACVYA
jgi:hypothetical protein